MKKSAICHLLLCCFMVFAIYSCKEDDTNILSDLEDLPAPTLTSITESVGFGGEEATIEGTGFSTNPSNNLITFGPSDNFGFLSVRAEQATATSLTFTKPVISAIDATVATEVRVSRLDAKNPMRSNELDVAFLPLISTYASDLSRPRGIAFDSNGDGYISIHDFEDPHIVKVTDAGVEDYVHIPVTTNLRGEIEFDSQDNLWVGTAWELLWKIPPGPGEPIGTEFAEACSKSVSFDANGNLYATNEAILRVTPDGTESELADLGWPGGVSTVADGYLYWWIKEDGILQKAPITAEGIGSSETILEHEEGKYWPSTIVVDTDGNVYGAGGYNWGNDHATSIYKITPDGTESVVYELGVSLWGLEFHEEYIYVTTDEDGRVLRCYMNGAIGAGR